MIHKLIYALKTTRFKAIRTPDFISHLTNTEKYKCNVADRILTNVSRYV